MREGNDNIQEWITHVFITSRMQIPPPQNPRLRSHIYHIYHLILLTFNPHHAYINRLFKIEVYWLEESSFDDVVINNWCNSASTTPGSSYLSNLRNFTRDNSQWKSYSLGHILKKKKSVDALMNQAQLEFELNPSRSNMKRGIAYYRQYKRWAKQENFFGPANES